MTIHSGRLERWLGAERVEALSRSMYDWYGPPIVLIDCPGTVKVHAGGGFSGDFERGYFACAMDSLADAWRRAGRVRHGQMNVGFTSISDALAQASSGNRTSWYFQKTGSTGVVSGSSTLWRVGAQPAGGSAGAAAAAGTAHVDSDTGGFKFTNPGSGGMRLTGADVFCNIVSNSLLLYDRLFSVAKTMSSSGTEAVTGVPTRYQSVTATAEDYAGGNFGFIEVFAALSNTAHNWTVCKYTNEAGTTGQTLPSVTGIAQAIIDRLDQPTGTWFTPLASGDLGIAAWSQMQCSSASLTGNINFCIGHPLAIMSFPVINMIFPFDWLTSRNQTPRIFNDACLAFLEMTKPTTTATTYNGMLYTVNTAT